MKGTGSDDDDKRGSRLTCITNADIYVLNKPAGVRGRSLCISVSPF